MITTDSSFIEYRKRVLAYLTAESFMWPTYLRDRVKGLGGEIKEVGVADMEACIDAAYVDELRDFVLQIVPIGYRVTVRSK